jgi:phage baseplate assembly protein W
MTERAISLPFSFDSAGAVAYSTDEKKILQDRVVLVVMTRINERVMRPTYGSEAANALFENGSSASSLLKDTIATAFSNWLSDLILTEVDVSIDPIDGYVVAEIFYRYNPIENEQSVKIKTAILSRTGEVLLEVQD